MRKQRNRNKGSSRVQQVVSVPTHVRPSYAVPLAFNLTGAGTNLVTVPASLNGTALRVTSVTGTFGSVTASTMIISLFQTAASGTETCLITRPIVVAGNTTEIKLRNDRRVLHSQVATSDILMSCVMSAGTFVGTLNVSILGTM